MNGKMIGVDYGDVRTGIASSDLLGLMASAVCTVKPGGMKNTAVEVAKIAKAQNAVGIVVGMPKNMDGSEGPRAEKSRAFRELLERDTGLPVVLWDERRSSIEAHAILHANGKKEKQHRRSVDAVAASLILEGYLGSL